MELIPPPPLKLLLFFPLNVLVSWIRFSIAHIKESCFRNIENFWHMDYLLTVEKRDVSLVCLSSQKINKKWCVYTCISFCMVIDDWIIDLLHVWLGQDCPLSFMLQFSPTMFKDIWITEYTYPWPYHFVAVPLR
jgi:hypothetical protein